MKSGSRSVTYGSGMVAINRIFYFRASIPRRLRDRVGFTELKISLGTPYLKEARVYARRLAARAQSIIDAIDGGICRNMDHAQIKELAVKYMRIGLEFDEERRRMKSSLITHEEAEKRQGDIDRQISESADALKTFNYSCINAMAKKVLSAEGIDFYEFLTQNHSSFNDLCRELLKLRIEALKISRDREKGIYCDIEDSAREVLLSDDLSYATPQSVLSVPDPREKKRKLPTLSEVFEIFFTQHSTAERGEPKWKPATCRSYRTVIKQLVEAIGDISISDITPEHLEKFKTFMFHLPSNRNKLKDSTFAHKK